jgi:hypothetical protein
MKKQRCLPTCMIARNVCLLMLAIAGGVLLSADLYAAANLHQERTESLRRLFVYQILVGTEQQP